MTLLTYVAQMPELKLELKLRGLPVSGTKVDLIERLKSYQDLSNTPVAAALVTVSISPIPRNQTTSTFPSAALSSATMTTEAAMTTMSNNIQFHENSVSPTPTSPAPSEQSNLSTDDSNLTDMFTELVTMVSPSQLAIHTSPVNMAVNEDNIGASIAGNSSAAQGVDLTSVDTEKDRKLQEKERQIVNLMRKLEHEQKLVEDLKIQLEIEKRCQHQQPVTVNQKHLNSSIKEENTLSNYTTSRQPMAVSSPSLSPPTNINMGGHSQNATKGNTMLVKQEGPSVTTEQKNVFSPFYVNSARQTQTAVIAQAQPHALLTTQTGTQLLLPLAIQAQNSNLCSNSQHLKTGNVKSQVVLLEFVLCLFVVC